MTPTNGTPTAKVTTTVFDLTLFDDVKLVKTISLPTQPTSLEDALQAAGNDSAKLLKLIHEGLIAEAKENARNDMSGFQVEDEDGNETPYTGKFADEEKGKKINNAILALAKMNGFEKSLPKDKKRELKEKATDFLRSNPAMLAGMQG